MKCALCDSPGWHGPWHDRANWARKDWRGLMLRAHYEQVLRMRPLPAPDREEGTETE